MWRYCTILVLFPAAIWSLCEDDTFTTCSCSRDVYLSLGLKNGSLVPEELQSGVSLSICADSAFSCCTNGMELMFQSSTINTFVSIIPRYDGFLNVSERQLFPSYPHVTNVVIPSILAYLNSMLPDTQPVQSALERILLQLNATQIQDGGRSFTNRMADHYSSFYLEQLRGIYNLPESGNYNDTFSDCASDVIEATLQPQFTVAVETMDRHFRSFYFARNFYFKLHLILVTVETNYPSFEQCLRAYAELSFCQLCAPESAQLRPCRNICRNVMTGCTILLNLISEQMQIGMEQTCHINAALDSDDMNLRTALQVIAETYRSVYELSTNELLNMANEIASSCSVAVPTITANPTPFVVMETGVPNLSPSSDIPSNLGADLHYHLITNLSSLFSMFHNVTERLVDEQCSALSSSGECWTRDMAGNDVDFVGIDYDRAVLDNPNMQPPDPTFLNNYNMELDNLRTSITELMNHVSDEYTITTRPDYCLLPLGLMNEPPTDNGNNNNMGGNASNCVFSLAITAVMLLLAITFYIH